MALSPAERSARYRAKDIEAFRAKKRALTKTPKHRDKRTEYMRKYRAEHREAFNKMCKESHNRIRRNRTPEARHDQHLRSRYGITREDFLRILKDQGEMCLICETKTSGGRNWHMDHCHKTGKLRSILCNSCNPHLGWYEKNAVKVHEYLKAHA